jgi:hypothetical protein
VSGNGKPTFAYAAYHVEAALRQRYCVEKGWFVADEVTDNHNTRRADLVAIHCWNPCLVVGHEVKVSRGDWLREVGDPGKHTWIIANCHQRWLVAPKGVILREEVPPGWGLLDVVGEAATKTRVAVAAPMHDLGDVPSRWVRRLLWNSAKREADAEEKKRRASIELAEAQSNAREDKLAERDRQLREREIKVSDEVALLEGYWREMAQLAGEHVQWSYRRGVDGDRAPRFPAPELFEKMKAQAATRVLKLAKQAGDNIDALIRTAGEPVAEEINL